MSEISKEKSKFRNTKAWKEFRKQMKENQKIDYLTLSKLTSKYELHHCLLTDDIEQYKDLDVTKFICLNNMSHSMVHFFYNQMQKDEHFIERLLRVYNIMKSLNKNKNNNY